MLILHAGLPLPPFSTLNLPKGILDIASLCPSELVQTLETICQHKSTATVWVGYLDPLWMLTEPERIRMRECIRKLTVYMVCSNPRLLPMGWKMELQDVYVYEQE
jgi:hypothetical protein